MVAGELVYRAVGLADGPGGDDHRAHALNAVGVFGFLTRAHLERQLAIEVVAADRAAEIEAAACPRRTLRRCRQADSSNWRSNRGVDASRPGCCRHGAREFVAPGACSVKRPPTIARNGDADCGAVRASSPSWEGHDWAMSKMLIGSAEQRFDAVRVRCGQMGLCDLPRWGDVISLGGKGGTPGFSGGDRMARRCAPEQLGTPQRELARQQSRLARARQALESREKERRERERRALFAVWRRALPVRGTPVEDYLHLRKLKLPPVA
jgi:hypothetical protein